DDESFFPDRALKPDEWVVPGYVVPDKSRDRLLWKYGVGEQRPRRRTARSHLLEGFIGLAEAKAEEIANYARKYGVLGICRHELPPSHATAPDLPRRLLNRVTRVAANVHVEPGPTSIATGLFDRCPRRRLRNGHYWEPLDTWRKFARDAKAMLACASSLRSG